MDTDKLIKRTTKLINDLQDIEKRRQSDGVSQYEVNNLSAQIANLIHSVTGSKSSYAESLRTAHKAKTTVSQYAGVAGVISAFHVDLKEGNLVNLRQEIEAIVVSEIVTQSRKLLKTKGIHPAAAVIVACAGIEEFLRSWCEIKGINIPEKQRSLSRFAKELRANNEIILPIERRIQSWADFRNNAAHGSKWDAITKLTAERIISEIEDFILENQHIVGA